MRKTLILAVAVAVVVLAAVWGGSVLYANVQNSSASAEFTLAPQSSGSATRGRLDYAALAGSWIIGAGSRAGYRVAEVLNGQDATVVGRTDQVQGQATISGTTLTAAKVVVQMNALTTDSRSRDGQFQGLLKTGEFPTSTFALTQAVDIAAVVNGIAAVTTTGKLTIAGVSHTVTVTLNVQATEDGVEVQGSIPITFADFGVSAPNLGFVKVQDAGSIEMLLQLSK